MLRKASTNRTVQQPQRSIRKSLPNVGLGSRATHGGPSISATSTAKESKGSSEKRKPSRIHLGRLQFLPGQEEEPDPSKPISQYDFFLAASSGKIKSVRKYLDDGGDVNAIDSLCNTPLHWACRGSNLEVVQTLVANKAKVNKKDQLQNTPLHVATRVGFVDCVNYLLECGAKINERDCEGDTAIHEAVRLARPKVVKNLILHGADIEIKNMQGKTAADMIQVWFNNTKGAITYAEEERNKKGIDKEKLLKELEKKLPFFQAGSIESIEEVDEDETKDHASTNVTQQNDHDKKEIDFENKLHQISPCNKNVLSKSPFLQNEDMALQEDEANILNVYFGEACNLASVEDALSKDEQCGLRKMENALPLVQDNVTRSKDLPARAKSLSDINS